MSAWHDDEWRDGAWREDDDEPEPWLSPWASFCVAVVLSTAIWVGLFLLIA
jgi:hypothetical protein